MRQSPQNSGLSPAAGGPDVAGSMHAGLPWMAARTETAAGVPLLAVRDASKIYGALTVLDKASVDIHRGEFLTLLGPSGSGKTTLLMMIAGFVEPTAGSIMLGDRDISRIPPEARGFGMVFQGYALFPHMTVAENVSFPLRIRRMGSADIRERVTRTLDMVQLTHLADRRPRQLSGGQQQRVALARALVFEPGLLLLDEPLGALDRKLRVDMQLELKQLHEKLGTSFIYVTHDQEEALSMSDRIAVLHRGRLAQVDTPGRIYERPKTRFVADFLGESNFFTGKVTRARAGGFIYEAEGAEFLHSGQADVVTIGETVLIALRPENIQLSRSRPAGGNALPVRVAHWSYFGSRIKGVLRTVLGNEIIVNLAAGDLDAPMLEGHELWAVWEAKASVPVDSD